LYKSRICDPVTLRFPTRFLEFYTDSRQKCLDYNLKKSWQLRKESLRIKNKKMISYE